MDKKTVQAYAKGAEIYSSDWLAQPSPADMYSLLKKYFIADGKTADIGCGNGRDADWLMKNGFSVCGFDSSKELVQIASGLYPKIQFSEAFLPDLKEINSQFDNLLCETVIMHLLPDDLPRAINNLKRILKVNGILYLSWRVTDGEDSRHSDGRLYSAFSADFILKQFERRQILHFEDSISASSGKRICRLIYKHSSNQL
jgi:SAM-dependent methyltransferase